MGIINLTPDSFSDGGAVSGPDLAAERARQMAAAGAAWVDVGGESTRPGAEPVSEAEELARVIPAIAAIRAHCAVPLSIDTRRPGVAKAAMAAGASMWNDISALRAPGALETAAALGCAVVLMHMQGEPANMQERPRYRNVVVEVAAFLEARARAALAAGIARERIWLDPGIGFGKTLAHNLRLMRGLGAIADLGFPVVLGASRKGMIGLLDATAKQPNDRLGGSIALALAAARAGASMVRVHDVRETVQALKVEAALHG
jgi:dihydropteroate synthase